MSNYHRPAGAGFSAGPSGRGNEWSGVSGSGNFSRGGSFRQPSPSSRRSASPARYGHSDFGHTRTYDAYDGPGRRPPSPTPERRYAPGHRSTSPGFRASSHERFHSRSPLRRPPSPSSASTAYPMKGIKTLTATVKEYVNNFSGILELSQDPDDRSIPPTAFFHASITWIVDRSGNPYGPPVKYLDVLGPNVNPSSSTVSLEKEFPIGAKVNLTVKEVESPFVNFVALQVWPMTSESPPKSELHERFVYIEKKQDHYLKEFHNATLDAKEAHSLVQATFPIFPWGGSGPDSAATVWQIKDENFGVVEVKGSVPEPFRFFALFHRDHVWLKDGKRARDVEFFRNKPLNTLVEIGQPLTVSARSIVRTSGVDLRASILELQAVIVSLNVGAIPPSAPKPTVCFGGSGAFGMGAKTSWYFFRQDLHNQLNKELVTYLNLYKKDYPDLHPACLKVEEPKRSLYKVPSHLKNTLAQVKEHPSPEYFILENIDRTHRCLVPASRALTSRRGDLRDIFPLASMVHFNAVLMSEDSPVQYVATLAWSKRDIEPTPDDFRRRDLPVDQEIRYLYKKHIDSTLRSSGPPPTVFEGQLGNIHKILNENFGIIESGNRFVLFDVYDVSLDPRTTLDKVSGNLMRFFKVGNIVRFHATLIDENASVPYLANGVWLVTDEPAFQGRLPVPIRKDGIHQQKIEIYRQVVQTLGPMDPVPRKESSSERKVPEKWDLGLLHSKNAVYKLVFYDDAYSEHQHILGGIVQFDQGLAFFLTKHSLVYSSLPAVGKKIRINVIPNSQGNLLPTVPYIAVSLFQQGDVVEDERQCLSKLEISSKKLADLCLNPNVVAAIENLANRGIGGFCSISSNDPIAGGLKVLDEVPYSTLKCMIDEKCGILQNDFDHKSLCYFEIDDINVEAPFSLKDVTALMNKMDGVRVRYQAKMINDKASIQYVAHNAGVQIMGPLPPKMSHITLKSEEMSDQPVGLRSEKIIRYRKAEEKFRQGKILSMESILDGSYNRKPDIVAARGIVRLILNENFALIYGPLQADPEDQSYCLFDTYDLYISPDLTAADAGKHVESLIPAGTEVTYNACFISGDRLVSFLATSVWASNNMTIIGGIPPLSKDAIQEDKINIFNQVSESCEPILTDLIKSQGGGRSPSRNRDISAAEAESRRDDIRRVYSSDHYKLYVKEVPKHKRSARDPRTPDRAQSLTGSEWNENLAEWRRDIFRWIKKHNETHPGVRDRIAKNDLLDHFVTGTLFKEVDNQFAILKLSNGSKALLDKSRVWLHDKPLYGDNWRPLKNNFFNTLRVNARKWKGPHGIDYQVTFCHSGMNKVDFKTKNYIYSSTMKSWFSPLMNVDQLDLEAAEFEAVSSRMSS